jgi:hypothetical protein
MIKTRAAQCRGASADGVLNPRSPVNPIRKSVRLAADKDGAAQISSAICVLAESVTSDIWLVVGSFTLSHHLEGLEDDQALERG